jgi:hypothetical protein
MGWDSSRPVPWARLVREWLIYAAIMTGVFLLFFRDDNTLGLIGGVLISGPLYLALGAVLAKFGYQRQRLKDLRAETRASSPSSASSSSSDRSDGSRPKPAPTSRTGGGGNRPRSAGKRRR